jgi:ATP-binding cassette, subfamily B, bacterial
MAAHGIISLGTFVAFIGMAKGIIWPLQQLGRLIAQLSTTSVSYNRIHSIFAEHQEDLDKGIREGEYKLRGDIEFDHVHFRYNADTSVLKDVTFQCSAGSKIALIGEPGSGKTSLVNLLPRFYDHTRGSIRIDGKPVDEYSRHFLRRHIGIVEQEPFLFSTDIRSNITYGVNRQVTHKEIEDAAKSAHIHDSILAFPKGYETVVGEKGVTLSGGQKQRIAIARTLLKDPAILVLDDSTSAVDAETEAAIHTALNLIMESRTTFIIAHRIQSLVTADLILVFKDGQIIQRGKHEYLVTQPGFYQKIFALQTQIEAQY